MVNVCWTTEFRNLLSVVTSIYLQLSNLTVTLYLSLLIFTATNTKTNICDDMLISFFPNNHEYCACVFIQYLPKGKEGYYAKCKRKKQNKISY